MTGTYHTMGGENLHEIQFDDCELPLENLVIREDGFKQAADRLQYAALPEPLDLASAWRKARSTRRCATCATAPIFGQPIADFQGVRWKLADMYQATSRPARGLLYRACMTANPFPDPFLAGDGEESSATRWPSG